MTEKRLDILVRLGETSPLKSALNEGVAKLATANEPYFQPHLCLNGEEGLEVIKRIVRNPSDTNTEFQIDSHIIQAGDEVWLNLFFSVFIDKICYPTNNVQLSPRQSAYIVNDLSHDQQAIILKKIKDWYFDEFLVDINNGLAAISQQFSAGDPLLQSDQDNRIFDIHGGRSMDVPYTEWEIVGEELFSAYFWGGTWMETGRNGYEHSDRFLSDNSKRQKAAVDNFFGRRT